MKKLVSLLLAIIFLFAGSSCAETKGVNLMEFTRRFYRSMEAFEQGTPDPKLSESGKSIIFNSVLVVGCDENLQVTNLSMVVDGENMEHLYTVASALAGMNLTYGEITLDSAFNNYSEFFDNRSQIGDYTMTICMETDNGVFMVFKLQ